MSIDLITNPLLGKTFDINTQNCLHTVRGFFELNSDVRISDWACPSGWWEEGMDLFKEIAHDEGFRLFHGPPSELLPGDVALMALGSRVGNHIGVILPSTKLLHHMIGTVSRIDTYGGSFRNNTVAVYRHPDVSFVSTVVTMTLSEALRPYERAKLEKYFAR